MLETALVTFREGLEAFLIIAITLAYLYKTGRGRFAPAIYLGTVVALLISATTGMHIASLANNPIMEGALAMTAGALVASFTWVVMKTSSKIRTNIHSQIDRYAEKPTAVALLGMFAFTVLMITREGMETALMLGSMTAYTSPSALLSGGLLGLTAVALIGWAWVKNAHRIDLRLFMRTTGIFLILFAIHLFIYGIHEMSEVSALPFVNNYVVHNLTENLGPETAIGQGITYILFLIPFVYIGAVTFMRSYYRPIPSQAPAAAE
ncbi:MAG: FTR1 family protein [Pseudobdellovibrionaceae bacterium]